MAPRTLPLTSSAQIAVAITPNDSADLTVTPRWLYVAGGGDLKVTDQAGNTLTLTSIAGGQALPFSPKRIWATDTTATGLVALL